MDGSVNGKSSLWFVKIRYLLINRKSILYYFFLIILNFTFFKSFKNVSVDDIKIYGNEFITKRDLIENSSLSLPQRLINIKTKFLESELKRNLFLKNISVRRQLFPFGLSIFVESRKPIARAEKIDEEKIVQGFIDKEGFFINKKFAILNEELSYKFKVFGWREMAQEIISKIIIAYKNNKEDISAIYISEDGFLVLEEAELKKILLGNQPEKIDKQLKMVFDIKNQLADKEFFEKIEYLDITDTNNPTLKVFKP